METRPYWPEQTRRNSATDYYGRARRVVDVWLWSGRPLTTTPTRAVFWWNPILSYLYDIIRYSFERVLGRTDGKWYEAGPLARPVGRAVVGQCRWYFVVSMIFRVGADLARARVVATDTETGFSTEAFALVQLFSALVADGHDGRRDSVRQHVGSKVSERNTQADDLDIYHAPNHTAHTSDGLPARAYAHGSPFKCVFDMPTPARRYDVRLRQERLQMHRTASRGRGVKNETTRRHVCKRRNSFRETRFTLVTWG